MSLLLAILMGGFFVFIWIGSNEHVKRAYNNGICINCKHKLRSFDMDSSGATGYICDNCGYTVWK